MPPVDIANVLTIETADWQPAFGEVGFVVQDMDDIDQCIRTILLTPKGSLAHQPEFGSDLWLYLDWPLDQARPQVIREIVDAIERWEPRVEITAVSFEADPDDPTHAIIQMTRRRRGALDQGSVLVFNVSQ